MTTGPDAGWYDDGTGKQRWWDGTRWGEQFIVLDDYRTELHTGAVPVSGPAGAGWYDDGRGRERWWDGERWTDAVRYSGSEESFAGIVVDGRWIHFGAASEPVAGATADVHDAADLLRRGRLGGAATARALYGPAGLITPRLLKRAVEASEHHLLVQVSAHVWLAGVPSGDQARAAQFATWINTVSDHYRYR
jgi:hypothetical protein